jgi:CRISPR-associated endonuclease/helicase Cas3
MPAPEKRGKMGYEMGGSLQHEDCWAKTKENGSPGINVRNHCLNVGCVAEALLALLLRQLQQLIPSGAATLAALHDVGKVSPGFQVKSEPWLIQHELVDLALREDWRSREPDHAKTSQFTVQKLLRISQLCHWAAAVGAHHGRIKGERVAVAVPEPWEQERVRLANELIAEFGALPNTPPSDATTWLIAGLITVADWIGSDDRYFPQDARWDMAERRRRAQAALASINWEPARTLEQQAFTDLFPEIPEPNSLQTATLKAVREPGVYVIEGPMGYGKTEAALAAAYQLLAAGRATGVYFALPTQVTSNRIHLRVLPFVDRISTEPATVRLAHGASWLVETKPPVQLRPSSAKDRDAQEHVQTGRSWFASAKRALLVPFGVGTIDQALLGIVAAKHFFVRQFGLAGKVVILDEVHTYDLYTSTLVTALVTRLRELGCTVIVLSATLTEIRRCELLNLPERQPVSQAYPVVSGMALSLVEQACEPPPPKTVQIRSVSDGSPVREAVERARCGECVLWIRNTVDQAQSTYRQLRKASLAGGPNVALLHSRFPFFQREELETDWMERLGKDASHRPVGCVLVSTQVAEQSVDIDADLLITDLAPTDMLLQRLGRLWRHDRPSLPCSRPEIWIQMPDCDNTYLRSASGRELRDILGKSARVYDPYVLLRSLQQWRTRPTITLPGDLRQILEATYADTLASEPPAWRQLRKELEKEKDKMVRQARSATSVWNNPALQDEEGIQTRYNTYPTAQLLLARQTTRLDSHSVRLDLLNGEIVTPSGRDWDFKAAKSIHRNLVRVPHWAVAAALVHPPRWLTNHVSQATAVGLVRSDGSIRWPGQEKPTGLAYDAGQGVIIKRESAEQLSEPYD